MGCDSWIFVHKHIANCDDGNGRIIERKVFWNFSSWETGSAICDAFSLDNGTYRSTSAEDLVDFAESRLNQFNTNSQAHEHDALANLLGLLSNIDPNDDFFVSVDW